MKGLLLVAHGSRRKESNEEFMAMVAALKPRLESRYTQIKASFLEFALPGMDEALDAMIREGTEEIQIYPFFLNSGKHVHQDIPEKISELQKQYPRVQFKGLKHFGASEHILSVITQDLKEC